jgi:hypothetical protein
MSGFNSTTAVADCHGSEQPALSLEVPRSNTDLITQQS